MLKEFFIYAILMLPNGQPEVKWHQSLSFESQEICDEFVIQNLDMLVQGLKQIVTAEYGYETANIITLRHMGCSVIPEIEVEEKKKIHVYC